MHIEVLRLNFNHYKDNIFGDYLTQRNILNRIVIACLGHIDKLFKPLDGMVFEEDALQQLWLMSKQAPNGEELLVSLGLHNYRAVVVDSLDELETFIRKKFPNNRSVVFVQLTIDATCHLVVQLRYF